MLVMPIHSIGAEGRPKRSTWTRLHPIRVPALAFCAMVWGGVIFSLSTCKGA